MSRYTTDLSTAWRRMPFGVRSAGLNLGRQFAGLLASRQENADSRACWLELGNKITAYRLFEGCDYADQLEISRLDAYSRLFVAEGFGYRKVVRPSEMPAGLSPIAIHAGVGLRLAEQTLTNFNEGKCDDDPLAAFLATCRQDAREGFGGIMEEALGFVARTLYPHLIERLDGRLQAMNDSSWARFWHGVGRGIYFVPGNLPPSHAAPWKGLSMCASEPPHKTGKLNALSGFCFALTLVNLRQAEVFDAFFKHHEVELANCSDGVHAAMAIWELSTETPGSHGIADEYCHQPELLFSARSVSKQESYHHKETQKAPKKLAEAVGAFLLLEALRGTADE